MPSAPSVTGPSYAWNAPPESLYSVVAPASVARVSAGSLVYHPSSPSGAAGASVATVAGASVSAAPTRKYSNPTVIGVVWSGPMAIRPSFGPSSATVTEPGDCTQVSPSALIAAV